MFIDLENDISEYINIKDSLTESYNFLNSKIKEWNESNLDPIFLGLKDNKIYNKLNPNYAIEIINYESLHKIQGKFDCIVLDESHSLGAYPKPSKRTKMVKDIILKQLDNVPDDKKDLIIQGKLNKFLKENTLLGQALITDPKKSVSSFLSDISKNNNISLNITSMDLYTI